MFVATNILTPNPNPNCNPKNIPNPNPNPLPNLNEPFEDVSQLSTTSN